MSDVAISAEGLGKRYLIGHQSAERERYTALRDVVGRSLKRFGRSALDMMRGRQIISGDEVEEFWALKDVSFEIKRGEVVGIVGRNGAGKSTLLKILSRITEPSEGRVTIAGRVASLLEVGTGFHPELTGRENIYLNGAILGMSRAEIRKKFDEIVDFAGVEKFLDTPVKRYSSGMYVRLAFAVAAHLEPEILVVDEVLAVGDAEFQKKCLGKMQDVAGHGRTVLFVSHNMGAISSLCSLGVLLSKGNLIKSGPVPEIVSHYMNESASSSEYRTDVAPTDTFCVLAADVRTEDTDIFLRAHLYSGPVQRIALNVLFRDANGVPLGMASCGGLGSGLIKIEQGKSEHLFRIDASALATGTYTLGLRIHTAGKILVADLDDILLLQHEQRALPGYIEAMDQRWGHGSIQFHISRVSPDVFPVQFAAV